MILIVTSALLWASGRSALLSPAAVVAEDGAPPTDDPVIKMGSFIKQIYRGTWRSSQDSQYNFVHSKTGHAFFVVLYNETVTNKVSYKFRIMENFVYQNPSLHFESNFTMTSPADTTLRDTSEKAEAAKLAEYALVGEPTECDMDNTFQLFNKAGLPLSISTPLTDDIVIRSRVTSKKCQVNVEVELGVIEPDWVQAMLFVLLEAAVTLAVGWPFLQAARFDSISNCHFLSTDVLVFNTAVDFGLLFTNMFLGNQIIIGYKGFFLVLTFLKMLNSFTKLRAFIQKSEMQAGENPQPDGNPAAILCTLGKMMFAVFALSFFVRVLLVYFWCWLIVFTYPLLQIYHNCFYVSRKRAFTFQSHFLLFFGQITYLLFLYGWRDSFLGMPTSPSFCLALVGLVLAPLVVMYLQSKLGTAFFLPQRIRDTLVHYKKIKVSPELEGKECVICFMSLSEAVQEDQTDSLVQHVIETPCKHAFHNFCLKTWMETKMNCPICRTKLPPDYDD